jgi:hypothetical protein
MDRAIGQTRAGVIATRSDFNGRGDTQDTLGGIGIRICPIPQLAGGAVPAPAMDRAIGQARAGVMATRSDLGNPRYCRPRMAKGNPGKNQSAHNKGGIFFHAKLDSVTCRFLVHFISPYFLR